MRSSFYDTYGFPIDLTEDAAEEHGMTVDMSGFENVWRNSVFVPRKLAVQKQEKSLLWYCPDFWEI